MYEKYNIDKNLFIISYIGTIGQAHGLEVILEAAKMSKNDKYLFMIIGDGSEKDKLKSIANKYKLSNVIFIDSLKWQEIIDIQQIIDINFIHLKPIDLFKGAIPSKIFESMYFSKPIILGVHGEAQEIITSSNSGIIMKPGDKNSMIECIEHLYGNHALLQTLGENGNKYVKKNYNRDNLASQMIHIIENSLESNKANKS